MYPEEALLLSERSVLLVEHEGERVSYHKLYEDVIDLISLECHLAYLKLKSLDYLVFRYGKSVRSFEGDASVFKYLKEHPESSLLKVSYPEYYYLLLERVHIDRNGVFFRSCHAGDEQSFYFQKKCFH